MTWFKTNDASVSNGGTVVAIGDGANTSAVKAGDALIIGSFQPVEVKAVFSGQIELVSAWNNSTQSGVAATAMPTSGDFKSATEALRNATKITQDNYKVIQDWGKETGTVTFVDYEGTEHEAKTMQEMENIFDASLAQREAAYDALIATSHPHWRTEADMHAMLAQNDDKFAASGFVHLGTSSGSSIAVSVNQGLYQYLSTSDGYQNTLRFGSALHSSPVGDSKTALPVINIAGFITDFAGSMLNPSGNAELGLVKFPDAPDGAVTYDSATGTIFDYATQTDPKYGDVAADHNEALARAFEGVIKNGDFRLGGNDWEDATGQATIDTDGALIPDVKSENIFLHSKDSGDGIDWTVDNIVEVYVSETEATGGQGLRIRWGSDYFGDYTIGDGETGVYKVVVPANTNSSSGGFKLFRYNGHGGSMRVKSVSVRPVGNEVVINRVDMWGFEGFLEKITPTNPFVYKHGLIQSQASDIDGVATTSPNRPDTYYAAFSGDTTSRGLGVDFLSLSTLEQDAIALNPKNHIYRMANGDLVQWRVRQRTHAGAGNGSWRNVHSEEDSYMRWEGTGNSMCTQPQGQNDDFPGGEWKANNAGWFSNKYDSSSINPLKQTGVFVADPNDDAGYNDLCYFLVCGTVQRLNQGAYHPVYNPAGCAEWIRQTVASGKWHIAEDVTSIKQCFTVNLLPDAPWGKRAGSGAVSHGGTGRSDKYEFHDVIYAGQVNDVRMSAWGIKDVSTALENATRKALRGEMRGRGKVKFTHAIAQSRENFTGSYTNVNLPASVAVGVGDAVWVFDGTDYLYREVTTVADEGDTNQVVFTPAITGTRTVGDIVVVETELSAEFDSLPWVDLVGDPIRLAATFPNGVVGKWVGGYVHGSGEDVPLNAKADSSSVTYIQTENDGATWSSGSRSVSGVANTAGLEPSAGTVTLLHYEALSDFTEAADNSKVVGKVGDVIASMDYRSDYGNRSMPSLIGKIGKRSANSSNAALTRVGMKSLSLYIDGTLFGSNRSIGDNAHDSTGLGVPDNGSHAFKALHTLTERDGQLFLQFHGQELVHNGTDWGDDDTIQVVNGDDTMTDLNGNTVKTFCHHSMMPIGWVKNEI